MAPTTPKRGRSRTPEYATGGVLAISNNQVLSSDLEVIRARSTTQRVPTQGSHLGLERNSYSTELVQQLRQSYQVCLAEEAEVVFVEKEARDERQRDEASTNEELRSRVIEGNADR